MSTDLQQWRIDGTRRTFQLHGVAGPSERSIGLNHWDADETHTFLQQVDLIVGWVSACGRDPEELARWRADAEAFDALAKALGKRIRSEWL